MGAHPTESWLNRAKVAAAERFVVDMHKQGWEHVERYGFRLRGPLAPTMTMTLPKRPPRVSGEEALRRVMAGDLMRAPEYPEVMTVPLLSETDVWEYELAAVFVRPTILVEVPSLEEERDLWRR